MKSWIKFLILGILALSLQISFPNLRIDWFLIVVVFAYRAMGLGRSLALALVLALFYTTFSLSPLWLFLFPIFAALVTYQLIIRQLDLPGPMVVPVLLLWAALFNLGIGRWYFFSSLGLTGIWGDIISMGLTVAMGFLGVPLFMWFIHRLLGLIPRRRSHMEGLPWYEASFKQGRHWRRARKPFGLEKGY